MSNDISRKIFDPLKDYLGVGMQQGRVQVDADWNELIDQFVHRIHTATLDTFSESVVPRVTPEGFLISGNTANLQIGAGRIYIDGVLAENHTDSVKWDPRKAQISGTARLSGIDLDAAPSGPTATTAYNNQPYYPFAPSLPTDGSFLVYLDVWQRDVTYLQDAELVDVAIGVDTTTRKQTVWQVKYLNNVGNIDAATSDLDIPGWLQTVHPTSSRLSTSTGELSSEENPCLLPPQAGYKGLENQLYRVQVHDGGELGTATFKWSRDNATVSTRVSAIPSANEIVVDSLGRDDASSFKEGQWVEVIDDYRELMGLPGELRRIQVGGIDAASRTITLDGAALPTGSGAGQFPIDGSQQTDPLRNTRIIRWDQAKTIFQEDESVFTDLDAPASTGAIEIPAAGTKIFLENGILVDFSLEDVVDEATFNPEFKSGDYWIFSARINDASLEILDAAPPQGTHHHFTKLAIVQPNNIIDCRTLWPPEFGGEGCACTVCVHPETHNNGTATIQQAINEVVAAGGGTVCLSVGNYLVREPLRIVGNSVTLKGQGWRTLLVAATPTDLIAVGNSEAVVTDIEIQNLFAITASGTGFPGAVQVTNCFGFNMSGCLVASLGVGDATSRAVQLQGAIAMTNINDNFFFAEQGIVGPRLDDQTLITLDVNIRNCIIFATQTGIGFSNYCLHMGELDIVDNQVSGASIVGIQLEGYANSNASISVADNMLTNCTTGISTGLSNIRLLTNDLIGNEESGGHGIVFVDGVVPEPEDHIQVIGNRISKFGGNAMTVISEIGHMMVKQNQVYDITGAGFFIAENGLIEYLSLENNQYQNINGSTSLSESIYVAFYFQALRRADIANNVFTGLANLEQANNGRVGIYVTNSANVAIRGNRLTGIGTANYVGVGVGILATNFVNKFTVENNEIARFTKIEDGQKIQAADWRPLMLVAGSSQTFTASDFTASDFTGNAEVEMRMSNPQLISAFVSSDTTAFAILNNGVLMLADQREIDPDVVVENNQIDARFTNKLAMIFSSPNYFGFINNTVRSDFRDLIIYGLADHIAANNNRIRGLGDSDVMFLGSPARKYVVMGNMTTGNIRVFDENGQVSALPPPWSGLNVII